MEIRKSEGDGCHTLNKIIVRCKKISARIGLGLEWVPPIPPARKPKNGDPVKNVMFQKSRHGMQRPFRKWRGAVATAFVAASGVAALTFVPSAQAASEYNVMLYNVRGGVGSVQLWDYTQSGDGKRVGCFKVQSGKDTNTGYKISAGHFLSVYMWGDSKCSSSYKGNKSSATVANNLSTVNFWFSLS